MNCFHCNEELPADARFCIECGASAAAPAAEGTTENLATYVRGFLHGIPIFAYDQTIWADPAFVEALDPAIVPNLRASAVARVQRGMPSPFLAPTMRKAKRS